MCYTIGIVEERLDFAVTRLVSANFDEGIKVSTNLHIKEWRMLRVNKNRNRALKRMRQLGIVDRKKEQEARLIKAGRLSLLPKVQS